MSKKESKEKDIDTDKKNQLNVFDHILIGIFNALLVVAGAVLGSLWRGICYVSKQHFDFEGLNAKQRQQRFLSATVVLAIVFVAGYSLIHYLFPKWKSNDHTTNLLRTSVIPGFPVNSFFETEGAREFLNVTETNYRYTSYSFELSKGIGISEESGLCQLVPRGEKLKIFSANLPLVAVGFQDDVYVYTEKQFSDLGISKKIKNTFLLLTKSKEELQKIPEEVIAEKISWGAFENNWGSFDVNTSGQKIFWVKARKDENAIICF